MNKILQKITLGRTAMVTATLLIVSLGLVLSQSVNAASYASLTSQMQFGSQSDDVTNLQLFLAAKSSIYPEGKVTGYYGTLTQAAVIRFQNQYGLDPVGRVGPLTLAKINSLIASGIWGTTADMSGPQFTSMNQSATSNSANIVWTTSELATAKVFYSTDFIRMNEGDINSLGFASLNGFTALNDGTARTSQQVVLTNLQPNTTYHYVVVSTDLAGNVSVWNPNTTFTTSI